MSNRLKEITYLTIKQLKKESIILPGKYSEIFEDNAKKLKVDLENQNKVFKDLKQDTDVVDTVIKKTNENLSHLHNSTTKAKVAIENNDSKTLGTVIEELEKMQSQINYLQKELFSDSLTQGYNRKWFMDTYLLGDRFPHAGHLAFIDLNRFKIINDSYGHIVGDQVLKYLVSFLKNELKSINADIVRYAGDEFIVLFNDEKAKTKEIEQIVKKIQIKLSKQKLKSSKVESLSFSFSYGLLAFKKEDDLEDVLNKANELMYENKKQNS